jgi:sensor histidine kinase regulating citrate/malate metabolism
MKWNSIRTKVLVSMAVCLIAGVGATLALLRYSFANNSQVLALESVAGAQRLFGILEARETSKMTAVGEALAINAPVRDAFAARDRNRLLELTAPLYPKLREQGITNWIFHASEPGMSVFLRLHNPSKFGDQLNRFMDGEVVRTHATVAGNELAKAGFAARVIRPFYDSRGQLTGYVEFGEEIGRFIHEMKVQTGDDYGLLLNKKFVDRRFWADSSSALHHADNWNEHSTFVVADTTSANDRIIQFDGDLASVAGRGRVLERSESGDSVLVRGIFPIFDSAHHTVGAMFVVKDISAIYVSMRNTQRVLVLVSVVGLSLAAVLVVMLLNRLVFRRLQHIIVVATRVVGGDFDTEIRSDSSDEIGQFEQLFEQFRRVFVDLLTNVTELQQK